MSGQDSRASRAPGACGQSTWGLWAVDLLAEAQAPRRKTGQGHAAPAACLRTQTSVTGGQSGRHARLRPHPGSWRRPITPPDTRGDKHWAAMTGAAGPHIQQTTLRTLQGAESRLFQGSHSQGESVVRRPRSTAGAQPVDGQGRRPSQAAGGRDWGARGGPAGFAPLLACGLPSLPPKLLLAGGGRGEGDALGVQEVQQLPRGHTDALLL